MSLLRRFGDLLILNTFVSSAKWWTLQCFVAIWKSYMHISKSSDPNTDPWGTPLVIGHIFEFKPLIETDCFWLVKYDLGDLYGVPLTP